MFLGKKVLKEGVFTIDFDLAHKTNQITKLAVRKDVLVRVGLKSKGDRNFKQTTVPSVRFRVKKEQLPSAATRGDK